jgi:nucleoside triphosphate pyrophosphatase
MGSMNSPSPLVCLASVSPRRRELLAQIGVPHIVVGADIDEMAQIGEAPRDYVVRMARQKALTVRERGESLPVLAADTTVVLDDVIYGKPRDREDGLAMLGRLSGRTHAVLTAVALADSRGVAVQLSVSTVRFRDLSSQECVEYWETGEPRDKAGGYAVQGAAAVFIESLSGSYSGVMGLPLFETAGLLRAAGVPYWEKRRSLSD